VISLTKKNRHIDCHEAVSKKSSRPSSTSSHLQKKFTTLF